MQKYLNRKVSIAICTYNGEKYIEDQLHSILSQSYKNIEVLVVDDCSTDTTIEICESIAKKDSRLRVYSNEINVGYNSNFYRAIDLCKGEYIALSDQDDIWVENKIEKMLSEWEEDTILMHHAVQWFDKFPLPSLTINKKRNASKCDNSKYLLMGNYITGCTIMMHKKLFELASPFPKNTLYDWWLGLVAYYNGKVQFINQPLIYQRSHEESSFFGKKRTNADNLNIQISFLESMLEHNALNQEDQHFAKKTILAYKEVLHKKFSLYTFVWFFKNRKYKFWYKNYKLPFLSRLIECIKIAKKK
ncbi:glycosyltransferase [Carboxylicivirga sp. N1Y90]|uniref:glycosyltransferase n=1 Tax=Carboxylicivirga fragile TaxID=3417571 RepID=UPI003D33CF4E|nr:glycosyltransferase [Marinilabiliaceae bacterium N1Y90]